MNENKFRIQQLSPNNTYFVRGRGGLLNWREKGKNGWEGEGGGEDKEKIPH